MFLLKIGRIYISNIFVMFSHGRSVIPVQLFYAVMQQFQHFIQWNKIIITENETWMYIKPLQWNIKKARQYIENNINDIRHNYKTK